MPRKSAEAKAADLWKTGIKPPAPPRNLSPAARNLWRRLASSKPAYFWTEGAKLLLSRLCQTAATVEALHHDLDADPAREDAPRLVRQLCSLNSSVATYSRQLRLNPMQEISSEARDRVGETGGTVHELIGGRASRSA